MAAASLDKKLIAVLSDASLEGPVLMLRYAPRGGRPAEIEDPILLDPAGEMATVYAVGRLLRILRAARVRVPSDPYALAAEPERALALARRCLGTPLILHTRRRLERVLVVWSESGVERFRGLVDFDETSEGLLIRRRGGGARMLIRKSEIIRYETSSEEEFVVQSVEAG